LHAFPICAYAIIINLIQTKASHSMEQHLTRQKNMLRAQVEKSIHKNTQITRIIRLLSSNLALSLFHEPKQNQLKLQKH
jgi:hypothetical protein